MYTSWATTTENRHIILKPFRRKHINIIIINKKKIIIKILLINIIIIILLLLIVLVECYTLSGHLVQQEIIHS